MIERARERRREGERRDRERERIRDASSFTRFPFAEARTLDEGPPWPARSFWDPETMGAPLERIMTVKIVSLSCRPRGVQHEPLITVLRGLISRYHSAESAPPVRRLYLLRSFFPTVTRPNKPDILTTATVTRLTVHYVFWRDIPLTIKMT